MKKPNFAAFAPIFGLLIFAVALWALHDNLTNYDFREIIQKLSQIPLGSLGAAFGLMFISYLLMVGYDWLSFRYIDHPLPFKKIALAALIGYSLSNNVGNVVITGGSVRFRIYSAWGLTALDITRVVLACSVTFALGVLTLGGLYFVLRPMEMPPMLHWMSPHVVHAFGVFFLLLVAAYLGLAFFRKTPFTFRGLSLHAPKPSVAISQVLFSSLDLAASAGILYVLLPPMDGFGFIAFLGYYLLAFEAGLISHVPGGLGVFESIMLVTLTPYGVSPDVALGALLAYRGIYYILPLVFGVALLLGQELSEQTHRLQPLANSLGWSAHLIVPNLMALLTFGAGLVLLLSGSLPAAHDRLNALYSVFPLALIETAHLLAGATGATLLLLARGVQRRSNSAYHFALLVLAAGIGLSLLKGIDYEEAMILTILLALMLPCRRHFYRQASFFNERFSVGWIAAIVFVLLTTIWLGLISHRRIPWSSNLWVEFMLHSDAARALRAAVAAMFVLGAFALIRLLRPAPPEPKSPDAALLEKTKTVVERSPDPHAWLALLGDKRLLYADTGSAFIMFGVMGRSWVALGDPIGQTPRCTELIWDFSELCSRHGGWPVFYQVREENLQFYLDLGLTPLKIGEEARAPLHGFSLDDDDRAPLREAFARTEDDRLQFEMLPPGSADRHFPKLREISERWLAWRNLREKQFALGAFNETYLRRFPIALLRRPDGEIIAFGNIWPAAQGREFALDLFRHAPDAPTGTLDRIFIELMMWGAASGFEVMNLGVTPLSGLENRELEPVWNRIGPSIFLHGEHFHDFQGLRWFKERFAPQWRPRYLMSPAGLALPQILVDINSLVSGRPRPMLLKKFIKSAETSAIRKRI